MKRSTPQNGASPHGPSSGRAGDGGGDPTDELLRRAGAEFRRISDEVLASELDQRRAAALRAARAAAGSRSVRIVPAFVSDALSAIARSIELSGWGRRTRLAAAYACVTVLMLVGVQGRGREGANLRTVARGDRVADAVHSPATDQTVTERAGSDDRESNDGELFDPEALMPDEGARDPDEELFADDEGDGFDEGAAEDAEEPESGTGDPFASAIVPMGTPADDEEDEGEPATVAFDGLAFEGEQLTGIDHEPLALVEEPIIDTEGYDNEL